MKQINPPRDPSGNATGFSSIDVIVVASTLLLLLSVAVPVWAAAQGRGAMTQCKNNLRAIGLAVQSWAKDHGSRVPWRIPFAEGGTHDLPSNGNAWVQWIWMSNYLASPKVLACPADKIQPAEDWGRQPNRGMLHPNNRGNVVSYFVGLDVQESSPQAFLAGDPNLETSVRAQKCDYANVNNASGLRPGDETVAWTTKLHGDPSHILRFSGEVDTLSSEQLRQALPETGAVHKDNHFLPSR